MTRSPRRHLPPKPVAHNPHDERPGPGQRSEAGLRIATSVGYAHSVHQSTTRREDEGVLSFAVIDAYSDIVLRTGTEKEWRQSRAAALREGEPGIIDDFDGRAIYVEDWRA